VHLGLITVVVREYDEAIRFFVDMVGFELVDDVPDLTNDGRPKRWVVVRPPGAVTGLLLARADGQGQATVVGKQTAGRVGFFLHVDDFAAAYARMTAAGVEFVRAPRAEAYGRVAVFLDIAGNTGSPPPVLIIARRRLKPMSEGSWRPWLEREP
jgi:catechol 2,3-dioxygenase-like lactoylglutathione lyase family enzyme